MAQAITRRHFLELTAGVGSAALVAACAPTVPATPAPPKGAAPVAPTAAPPIPTPQVAKGVPKLPKLSTVKLNVPGRIFPNVFVLAPLEAGLFRDANLQVEVEELASGNL